MLTTNQIRHAFLDYFARKDHQIIHSSSLVPSNDPSLLFTNAGMVQFKNVFLGQEIRPYSRATTAQKVVRAGGKHNDLDNVGYTARHHTFFEMMGNFSFADYFKPEAIEFAWTLVTKDFGLPKDKLLVTVFSEDKESATLWHKIAGLDDTRILRIPTSDNFWRMGDTGPCGPCSEIFYDHGPDVPGGMPGTPDENGDRFVEIWNLVFMQYFEEAQGRRSLLPHPSIDTGMGLERFAAIMQGKRDNYDIDIFLTLIQASADLTHQSINGHFKASHRVIADHLRSTAFLIADGVLPSRDGRGYVLRRIMRRAMRHLHMMGTKEPVFYKLLPALIQEMGAAYPELVEREAIICETMRTEEERFKVLLDHGLRLLEEEKSHLSKGEPLSGNVAFKLYDTFGFPLDLTQDALRESGHEVDIKRFEESMALQRQRARASWSGSGDSAIETIWFDAINTFGGSEFLGYTTEQARGKVQAIINNNAFITEAPVGSEIAILLNQTPFYGESGGQVGDTGLFTTEDVKVTIHDTQKKLGNLIVHYGTVTEGILRPEMIIIATVDHDRRLAVRAHHSATHLLHEAIRQNLGSHVTQKGSFNSPERLRFDVNHPRPITSDELIAIEAEVNARIRENSLVITRSMTRENAIREGAIALFGEKYSDEVRVVSMGLKKGTEKDHTPPRSWSIELCGGTHVARTGDIGMFRIISESGVSAGIRRIEAVAGKAAEKFVSTNEQRLHHMAALMKVNCEQAPDRLATLLEEYKTLEHQLHKLQRQMATDTASSAKIETIGYFRLTTSHVGDTPVQELKGLAETILKQGHTDIVILISTIGGKGSVVVAITKDLTEKLDAVALARAASIAMGGKGGGGRRDMAQAGGPNVHAIDAAFESVRTILKQLE